MAMQLSLAGMDRRHRALTPSLAGTIREAAAVCLSRHHALSSVQVTLSDNGTESFAELSWTAPGAQIQGAWANTNEATEVGACGCVIVGVELLRGMVAVRRAETGTGADYYVGLPGAGQNDLEDCIRLEVSGVDGGGRSKIVGRLHQKVCQLGKGHSSLPAFAGVMGFSARLLMLQDVLEST